MVCGRIINMNSAPTKKKKGSSEIVLKISHGFPKEVKGRGRERQEPTSVKKRALKINDDIP